MEKEKDLEETIEDKAEIEVSVVPDEKKIEKKVLEVETGISPVLSLQANEETQKAEKKPKKWPRKKK